MAHRTRAIALLIALATASNAHAGPLPNDAGIIDVRSFGAKGNGRDDDTAAFLRALTASGEDTGKTFWHDKIVYVPNGTYLVSAPLVKRYAGDRFASGLILIGESRDKTIIRLKDGAPDYGNADRPRAVIFTTSKHIDGTPTSGGKDYPGLGEGNDAYMNFIEDLTVDVGQHNPGAIGIDYLANNIGAIRNVSIRAPADSGSIGLSMTRKWPGPALVQNVSIQGFDIGIAAAQTEYGLTLEHIDLTGQRLVALKNNQNALSIRDLRVQGRTPAILNEGDKGLIALDAARLTTDGAANVANVIGNAGTVVLRDAVLGGASPVSGRLEKGKGWTSQIVPEWLPVPADPPATVDIAPANWVNVETFKTASDKDATDKIRRAFASGGEVVYFPHDTYSVSDAIEIPPTVRRIVGMTSTIEIPTQRKPTFSRENGIFRVLGNGPPLTIERLAFDNSYKGAQVAIEAVGSREVIIRDTVGAGVTLLDRKSTGGRAFVDNTCCGLMRIAGPRPVFARQLNTEGGGARITNDGSPLWILGLKTEGIATVVDNRVGAATDIFGGLIYMVRDNPQKTVPTFFNSGARLSGVFVEESLRAGSRYEIYVDDTTQGTTRKIGANTFPERGYGRFVPNLVVEPAWTPSQ